MDDSLIERPVCFGSGLHQPCDNVVNKLNYLTFTERSTLRGVLSCDICGGKWQWVGFSDGFVVWEQVL